MSRQHYDCIIIGGGISGCSFAQLCQQQKINTLLLEANERLGGSIETFSSEKAKNFWLEMGTHTCYNSYHYLLQYCNEQQIIDQLVTRQKHPFLVLNQDNHIQSIYQNLNLLQMGLGLLRFKFSQANERSVSEYFSYVFGQRNYQRTLRYCFDAVLCQPSQNFPADFLFKVRKKNKNFPRSFTFKKGMATLFNNIKSHSYLDIHLQSPCHEVSLGKQRWQITTAENCYSCDKLILATPWHIAQKLLAQLNHKISQVDYQPLRSHLHTLSLIFDKSKTQHIRALSGLIGINQNFYSAVTRDVVEDDLYRGFTVHFKSAKNQVFDNKALISDFLNKLNIKSDALIDSSSKENIVPIYHQKHQQFIEQLDHYLKEKNNLFITGNFFTRLAVEDCIKRSYSEFKRMRSGSAPCATLT